MENFLPHKLSDKELERGYWYVTHKEQLKKLLILCLIILNIFLIGFSVWGFFKEFVLYRQNYLTIMNELPKDLVDYSTYRRRNTPQDLQFIGINVLSSGKQKYDIVAKIRNINDRWAQTFDYYFIYANGQTERKKGFILPSETKFIYQLGVYSNKIITQPRIVLENQQWQRILNYQEFAKNRLKIEIPPEKVKYIPARRSEISNKLGVAQTTFVVKNNTPYNYWNVGILVLLYRGTSLKAVNFTSIEKFLSKTERKVTINWFQDLPQVNKVDIIPEVNILDNSVYMPIYRKKQPDVVN